jgi:hypothetical protein
MQKRFCLDELKREPKLLGAQRCDDTRDTAANDADVHARCVLRSIPSRLL